jgi:hypothetical protein
LSAIDFSGFVPGDSLDNNVAHQYMIMYDKFVNRATWQPTPFVIGPGGGIGFSDGNDGDLDLGTQVLIVDTINEKTAGAGVHLDGVQLKDGFIAASAIAAAPTWDAANNKVGTLSAFWTAAHDDVEAASGGWEQARQTLIDSSAGWDSTLENFNTSAEIWNQMHFDVSPASGGWNTTETNFNASSPVWNQAHKDVVDNSGSWNSGGSPSAVGFTSWNQARDDVAAASGGWNTTETNFNTSSVVWNQTNKDVLDTSADWNRIDARGSWADPSAGDNFALLEVPDAITISEVNYAVGGGTSVAVTMSYYTNYDLSGAATTILTTQTVVLGDTNYTSFSTASVPAGSWIYAKLTTVTGAVERFGFRVTYTRD